MIQNPATSKLPLFICGKLLLGLLIFTCLQFIRMEIVSAQEVTITWTGFGGDGDWDNGQNWDLEVPPTATDHIIIANNEPLPVIGTQPAVFDLADLTLDAQAILTVSMKLDISFTQITFENKSQLIVTEGTVVISSTITNNGGAIEVGDAGTLKLTGTDNQDLFASNYGNLIIDKSGGTASLQGNITATTITVTTGDFDSAGFQIDTGYVTIDAGGVFTAGASLINVSVDFFAVGTFTYNTSTLAFVGNSDSLLDCPSVYSIVVNKTLTTNTVSLGSGATYLEIFGNLTGTKGYIFTYVSLVQNFGNITVSSNCSWESYSSYWCSGASKALDFNATIISGASFLFIGGTNGSTVKGAVTSLNISTGVGNSITINGTLSTTAGCVITSGTLQCTSPQTLTIGTDITISANGTFAPGSSTVNITRHWINNGGTFTNTNSTITFVGAPATSSEIKGTAVTAFNNLTINKSDNTKIVKLKNNSTVAGTLLLSIGTLEIESTTIPGTTKDLDQTGTTVSFRGTDIQQDCPICTVYNLTINQGGTTGEVQMTGRVSVLNDFLLTGGGTGFDTQSGGGTYDLSVARNFQCDILFTARSSGINIAGNVSINGSFFDAGTSTVTLDGTGSSALSSLDDFYILTISKTAAAVVTCNDNLTVTNQLSIANSNSTLYLAGNVLDLTGATYSNNGVLRLQGSETLTSFTQDVNSGTTEFVGDNVAGTLILKDFGTPDYFHLKINDTNGSKRTFSLGAALGVQGDLIVASSALNTDITFSYALDVIGDINIQAAGTLSVNDTGFSNTFTIGGDWIRTGTFSTDTDSRPTFNGSGDQSIDATTFARLEINKGSGTAMLNGNITTGKRLRVIQGEFDTAGFDLDINEHLRIDADGLFTANDSSISIQGRLQNLAGVSGFVAGTSTVTMDNNDASTLYEIGDTTFHILNIDKTNFSDTVRLVGDVTVNLALTIVKGTLTTKDLLDGEHDLTVNGVLTIGTSCTLTANSSLIQIGIDFFNNGGTFTAGTGTVELFGASNGDFAPGSGGLNNLIVNKSGKASVVSLLHDLTINGNFTITQGEFDTTGDDFQIDILGSILIDTDGTLTANASYILVKVDWTTNGSFNSNGTVSFYEDSASTIYGSTTFKHLEIYKDSELYQVYVNDGITAEGNVLIVAGILTGANKVSVDFNGHLELQNDGSISTIELTLAGNLIQNGTMEDTVITLDGPDFSTIEGSVALSSLVISKDAGEIEVQLASSIGIAGNFTLAMGSLNTNDGSGPYSFTVVGDTDIQTDGTLYFNSSTLFFGGNYAMVGKTDVGTSITTFFGTSKIITGSCEFYDLVFSGSTTGSGYIVVAHDMTISATKTFNGSPGQHLVINEDLIWDGSYSNITNHTLSFSGVMTSFISGAAVKARDFYNLLILKNAGADVVYTAGFTASNTTNNMSVSGTYVQQNGDVDFGADHTIEFAGTIDFKAGTVVDNNNQFVVGSSGTSASIRTNVALSLDSFTKNGAGSLTLTADSTQEADLGAISITAGSLILGRGIQGVPTVNASTTLRIEDGAYLKLSGDATINGSFQAIGAPGNHASVSSTNATHRSLNFGATSTLQAEYADFEDTNGFDLTNFTNGTVQSFHDVAFTNIRNDNGEAALDFSGLSLARFSTSMRQHNRVFLDNISFVAPNVVMNNILADQSTARIKFRNYSGDMGGEAYENDIFNRIDWVQGVVKNLNTSNTYQSVQEAIDAAGSGHVVAGVDSNIHAEYVTLKAGVTLKDIYLTPPPGGESRDALSGVMSNDWAVNVIVRDGNIRNVANVVNCTVDGDIFGGSTKKNNLCTGKIHAMTDQDPNGILTWHMEGDAADSGNNGYDGTVTGATFTSTNAIWGQALSLNGTNQYVSYASMPSVGMELTMSCWVRWDGTGSRNRIMGRGSNYYLEIDNANDKVYYGLTTSYASTEAASTVVVTPNTWTHLAMTYNGSTIKLYVNGTLQGAGSAYLGSITNTGNFRVGARDPVASYFAGLVDDVLVLNRALSATEISQMASCTTTVASADNLQTYATDNFLAYDLGDYHLVTGADGIDSGDNTLWNTTLDPDTDFDGSSRIVNGGVSASVDPGAFEFNPSTVANWSGNQLLGGINDVAVNIVNSVIYMGTDCTGPDAVKCRVLAVATGSQGASAGQVQYASPEFSGSVEKIFFGRINGNETWIVATVDEDDDGNSDSLAFLKDSGASLDWNTDVSPGEVLLYPTDSGLSDIRPAPPYSGPLGKAIVIEDGSGTEYLYVVNANIGSATDALAKYDLTTGNLEWLNTGSGSDKHDYRGVPAFLSSAFYGGATGGGADVIRVTATNSETTVQSLGSSTGVHTAMFSKDVGGTKWLFVAPVDNFIYKLDSSNLNLAWQSDDLGGETTGGLISPTTVAGVDSIFVGGGEGIHRVLIADGAESTVENWTGGVAIIGNISSNIVARNGYLYFGTDKGWCYCVNITNATAAVNGYPRRITGGGAIVTMAFDAGSNQAIGVNDEGFVIGLVPGS